MRVYKFVALAAFAPIALAAQTMKNPVKGCAPLAKLDSTALMSDITSIAHDSTRGRYIGSPESAKVREFLAKRFEKVGLKKFAPEWIVDVPGPTSGPTNGAKTANVVGTVKGTKFPNEYIVITGHYDHLGVTGAGRCRAVGADSNCNGADDNASGTAALAILGQYFARNKPQHSIVFAAVDAEEAGMFGSRGFVSLPTVPLNNILLNINLDMLSRNDKDELYAAGSHKYPQLESLVQATSDCAPLKLTLGHDGGGNSRDDWTSQSDQGSFHRMGIPFIYFGVEDHPDYHTPSDEVKNIMPGFYVRSTRTVADFVMRFDKAPVARIPVKGP